MKFKDYFNRESNSNRIYTKPEIREMKLKDFFKKKKEFLAQYEDIGLPKLDDLKNSPNVTYVEDPNEVFGGRWESVRPAGVGVDNWNEVADSGSLSKSHIPSMEHLNNSLSMVAQPVRANGLSQMQPIKNLEEDISQKMKQFPTTIQDEVMTGGASDISNVVNKGIDKYLDLPLGTAQEIGKAIKNFGDIGIDKNNNMNLLEETQGFIYEKLLNNKYPIASNATIDGMHNFKAAKNQKNVSVCANMNVITNDKYKSYLKTLGAKDNTPGVIYGEHSDVSLNMANSPEMDAYITSIRNDVLNGKALEPFKDFCFDASGRDVLKGNDDKVSRMAAFRNIRMYDPKVDENGVFTCKLIDYSDFNKEPIKRIQDIPNAWGYDMQEKGIYQNYYQIINIRKKVNW